MAKHRFRRTKKEEPIAQPKREMPPHECAYVAYFIVECNSDLEALGIPKSFLKPGVTHVDGCLNRFTNIISEVVSNLKEHFKRKGVSLPEFKLIVDAEKTLVIYPIKPLKENIGYHTRALTIEHSLLGTGIPIFADANRKGMKKHLFELRHVVDYDDHVRMVEVNVHKSKSIFASANLLEFMSRHPFQKANGQGSGNLTVYCPENGIISIKKDRAKV